MEYLINLFTFFTIYTILALSLNLVVGYAGLISLAHAAFYALGAYATALLMTRADVDFFISALVGMGVTFFVSIAIGHVLSRFRDDYYMLVSLGFTSIMTGVLMNVAPLTNGPLGIAGIARPQAFGISFDTPFSFALLSGICAVGALGVSWWLTQSSFGRVLQAIREDEQIVKLFGYLTQHYKLCVFVLSALLASLAGSLFAAFMSFIDPGSFMLNESILILAMIILGGLASLRGSLLGALLLLAIPELLRFVGFPSSIAGQIRQLAYGLVLIVLMMYRPQGILGNYRF